MAFSQFSRDAQIFGRRGDDRAKLGYACLRVAGAWPGMLSDKAYGTWANAGGDRYG